MNYISLFTDAAKRFADRTAVVFYEKNERLSYKELDSLSSRAARKLRTLGIKDGDFVLIDMPRGTEYVAAYLAVLKAHAACVPASPDYPTARTEYIAAHCDAAYVIKEGFFDGTENLEPYCSPADGKEPALLVYTSGSTGEPKGILHSASDLARAAKRQTEYFMPLAKLDYAALAPMTFIAHVMEYLAVFLCGGTSHVVSDTEKKSLALLDAFYEEHGINAAFVPPQMLKIYCKMPSSLELVITGSERVSRIYSEHFRILNVYGMSETSHSGYFEIDREYVNTPLGKPFDTLAYSVCGSDGSVLPDGKEGEICIEGEFDVCYYKDAERTAKAMIKLEDGRTRIRTGDVGYINENGDAVYVDRMDWTVKINGNRVDTLGIETILSEQSGVKEAAVKAFADAEGRTYLAAYYTSDADIADGELASALAKKVPEYMIPRFFVRLDKMPKNLNGKLDRKALTPPDASAFRTEYKAPQNAAERALCEAFEKVLSCGKVGTEDDFFRLGGDSAKVFELIKAAGVKGLTANAVLDGRYPAAIAKLCEGESGMEIKKHGDVPAECPLTEIQKGVYLDSIGSPDSLMYNAAAEILLPDGTDEERLIEAVKTAAAAHRSLFVTVSAPDGEPRMYYKERDVDVPIAEAPTLEAGRKAFIKPFDLENGPLFRFEICRTGEGTYLFFDVQHIIFDGTSIDVLTKHVAMAYDGKELPEEGLTMFDAARSEKELADEEKYKEDLAYYEAKFGGAETDTKPVPDVVCDGGYTEAESGRCTVSSEGRLSASDVKEYAKAHGVTENALLTAAFSYTLAKYSGTSASSFASIHHGRKSELLAETTGMFVRTVPMYIEFTEDTKVCDYVEKAGSTYYETRHRDAVPFSELAERYGASTAISFAYHGELFDGVEMGGNKIHPVVTDVGESVAELELAVIKKDGAYVVMPIYRRAIYTEDFARSFADTFIEVASGMLKAERLCDVNLISEKAKEDIEKLNLTESGCDCKKTVVERFCETAEKFPENTCLVCDGRRYTYKEVDRITDILAKHLVKKGVGREKVVGIIIPRCENMLFCALGVLKAGGAYLPLDPSYPPERLNLMVKDSGAMLLMYAPEYADVITDDYAGMRMCTDVIPTLEDDENVKLTLPDEHDLFVMLYTSGSTGVPKGVMMEHGNVLVTSEWVKKYYKLDETSKLAQYASFGFDAHAYDFYPAVTSGAELHVITDDIRLDFIALRDYFNANGITHTVMTMQIGRQFALMGGFTSLRYMTVAGEKLTPLDPPAGMSFCNAYGPTEGSVVTSAFTVDKKYNDVPIGKAVDDMKLYITDASGRQLPTGAVGELWISGPHVTRGYLNRPEKNAEAYGENTFCSEKGYERVYRTGDIVRMWADGTLQFVGRRDAQVKVRGFRVELTEIEEVIRRFDGIKDATVAAFDDPAGGKFIAAYVVSDTDIDTEALADFIRAEKPPYMVPAVTVRIDKIPLNQNGKVNKKALPVPERRASDLTPPENETQKKIFAAVAEVIGHEGFGINTSVYEAGLTSIGAVKLNVALAKLFGVTVKIRDIKENDTVRKLEDFIAASAEQKSYEIREDYPLSEAQSGVFIECVANPDGTMYNMPMLIKLGERVDCERLAAAVSTAADAHPYIKTRLYTSDDGSVRARRNDGEKISVPVIKCGMLPPASELVRPFMLTSEPLYRIAVYKTPDGNYLFFDLHHLVGDGTSENILLRDIGRAYAGEQLSAESFTGYEAALADEEAREGKSFDDAREYFKKLLCGCDTGCLPKKEPENAKGGAGEVTVVGSDVSKIRAYCAANGITPNAYFNAAISLTLAKFCAKESVTYATVYNGRSDSRTADTVAMLVRTLPVTANIEPSQRTADFMSSMQKQISDSMVNDAVPFSSLATEYGVNADFIFVYQGEDFGFESLCGEKAELIVLGRDTAKAPISVSVFIRNGRFEYVVEYKKDLYSRAFAEAFADALDTAAENLASAEQIKDVSLLSRRAEEQYEKLNGNDEETERTFCHQLVEKYARETPDAPAVSAAGTTLTFAELNARANVIANYLVKLGVTKDTTVGILFERTVDAVAAELGVLKAGGAFLPMLPGYPDERLDFCLVNSDTVTVLTSAEVLAAKASLFADGKSYTAYAVEDIYKSGESDEDPNVEIIPEQLAYCIYTSGSTGTPKGVMIEHRNLSDYLANCPKNRAFYNTDCGGSIMALSSLSFDMSLDEIHLGICHGKHVFICSEDEQHDPMQLCRRMLEYDVKMITCTPSFINNLLGIPELEPAIRNLVTIVCGAEAYPQSLFGALKKLAPDVQLINGYGPTETTICCSDKVLYSADSITIGRPHAGVKMYVLDKSGNILPPYGAGELIICGEVVGRGYVKLPEKNAASFFELKGLRAYHSGDLVRLNGDAEIDFCGRIDNQVKLRGFRVELDEIENVMCSFEGVKQSKVIVRNNGSEDYLAAFFTASEKVDTDALTAYMKSKLTYYMVPSAIMQLDAMPMTPNGKIDKKALPEITRQNKEKKGRRAAKKSLEQRLCEIFEKVLGTDGIYADDNFFELGGTSLSASKVTMLLMSDGIEVKYGDIFDHPTPELLSQFIEARDGAKSKKEAETKINEKSRPALEHNLAKYAPEVKREPLGNVLLTGAVGFLGIHMLKELLETEEGHIYCLVRKGKYGSSEKRLKTMLVYYFSKGFEEELRDRITLIDADITDPTLEKTLENVPIDTVINSAACVKHFADDDILERINVRGVENLIAICRRRGIKLVQISTVSIPGIHTEESYEKQIKMHENELFIIDSMDNKYCLSKYAAETRIFDAIEKDGLRGKVIRVGNLMGRYSDGEFQANMETNMFLSGIRGFAMMGKYPISHMTDPMSFSPVDCTARAVVLLAGTNDCFTAFNANNRYGFDEMKLIDACVRNGIEIRPEQDEIYYEEFRKKLGDNSINNALNGLAAYDIKDAHAVDTDNLFTTNILYRIGFSWPLVDEAYLDRAINSIMTLDYFNVAGTDTEED